MKEFSRRVKTGWDYIPEFFFHRVFTVSGNKRYHVSVKDRAGHLISFNMEQKPDGRWKIVDAPKVPDWIIEMESALNDVILESMAA